jgi:xanthine dehydrogenase small subunit
VGISITLQDGVVTHARIGAGGVAAMPARAREAEAVLIGKTWNHAAVTTAKSALQAQFQPMSDMRASAQYRSTVLANLLERFWLESQGETQLNLEAGFHADATTHNAPHAANAIATGASA